MKTCSQPSANRDIWAADTRVVKHIESFREILKIWLVLAARLRSIVSRA